MQERITFRVVAARQDAPTVGAVAAPCACDARGRWTGGVRARVCVSMTITGM